MKEPPDSDAKEALDCVDIQLGADNAQAACDSGTAGADVDLFGHMVEVDPAAVMGWDHALCTQDHTVGVAVVKRCQNAADLFFRELLGCFKAPALEDLVCVMAMMVMMLVTAAGAVLIMLMMMFVLVAVLVVVMMFVLVAVLVVVMMLVLVAVLVMLMMMFVLVAVLAMVMVLMIVAAAGTMLVVFMLRMVVMRMLHHLFQFIMQ